MFKPIDNMKSQNQKKRSPDPPKKILCEDSIALPYSGFVLWFIFRRFGSKTVVGSRGTKRSTTKSEVQSMCSSW